ncbi:MAG TPA: BTAD domain-containing putative transcriptional regulator [Longimicrobiales bacterium]|nr:BTAD domain-containing putative transcriptional regulator [Longimicrobiales bacterium]
MRPILVQPKRFALLTYLAVAEPRGFHRRDSLLALLWPDQDAEHAHASLRQALYGLRQTLGHDVLLTRGAEVAIADGRFGCDVWEFEEAVEGGGAEEAVTLYRGEFLAGFFLSGAAEFEQWVDMERGRLARTYADVLERLAARTSAVDPQQGARYWRLLSEHDPYSSRTALRLMNALEAAGDAPAAIRHAEQHAVLLREELDAEPDAEVSALADRLRHPPPRPPPPPHGSAPSPDVPTEPVIADARRGTKPSWSSRRRVRLAVQALALVLGTAAVWWATAGPTDARPMAIAVRPFSHIGADQRTEYLAVGMTEGVISGLGIMGDLQVISTREEGRSDQDSAAWRALAADVGATQLVQGSLQVQDGRLRASVQLLDAPTEAVLLSRTYSGSLAELFSIESEIARDIARALGVSIPPDVRIRLARPPSASLRAYELYLRGVFNLNEWNSPDLDSAIVALEAAVEEDPSFAAARAALANAYNEKADLFDPRPGIREKAYVQAETALLLDPDLAEAHVALGNVLWTKANDFPHAAALREFRRAAELQPSLSSAHDRLAMVYSHVGLLDRSVEEARLAVSLNPLNYWARFHLGFALATQQRYAEATEVLGVFPPHVAPVLRGPVLAEAMLYLGRPQEAVDLLDALRDSFPTDPWVQAIRALVVASLGDSEQAEADISGAVAHLSLLNHAHHAELAIGIAYAVLGKNDEAVEWLRRAARGGFPCHSRYAGDPLLSSLRDDPRFQALLVELESAGHDYRSEFPSPTGTRSVESPGVPQGFTRTTPATGSKSRS